MGRALRPGVDKIDESWVKKEVKKILSGFEFLHWWMPPASQFGVSGQHDFMVCQRGFLWTIETKAAKASKPYPTELQIVFATNIRAAGGISVMVNENTLHKVTQIATHINRCGELPHGMADDFTQWSK